MLITNTFKSVYMGVSKQSPDLRKQEHCEEMINCYPSLAYGVSKRKPSQILATDCKSADDKYNYSYDKGLSGDTSEKYHITIDSENKLQVFDVNSKEYKIINYMNNSEEYLIASNYHSGFNAITIKDTTFITNKDIIPTITKSITENTTTETVSITTSIISLDMDGGEWIKPSWINQTNWNRNNTQNRFTAPIYFAKPTSGRIDIYTPPIGAILKITIDGIIVSYTTKVTSVATNPAIQIYSTTVESMSEYRNNVFMAIVNALSSPLYNVTLQTNGISIKRTDGIDIITSIEILPVASATIVHNENIVSLLGSTNSEEIITYDDTSILERTGYIWIRDVSIDSAFPYTYTLTVKENGTTIQTSSISSVDIEDILDSFETVLLGYGVVSVSNNVLRVVFSDTKYTLQVSDSYGNQGSISFQESVSSMDDLPKHFPFDQTILKVVGTRETDGGTYWIKYNNDSWVEWRDPNLNHSIDPKTMPHQLIRESDGTFTFDIVEWKDRMVGDDDTNEAPIFIGSRINDLFYSQGRLGFISPEGVTLSKTNDLNNLFRSTVITYPSDSPISVYIDTTKSVALHYAVPLGDLMVLFGDKQQYALGTNKALTPENMSIQLISNYEINKNTQPKSIGDKIFFAVNRGNYSGIMVMDKNTISGSTKAEDITAHIPNYIDSSVIEIISGASHDLVFVRAKNKPEELYVLKYYFTDQQVVQIAWGRWVFNAKIESVFVIDNSLYFLGKRYITSEDESFSYIIDYSKTVSYSDTVNFEIIFGTPTYESINLDPVTQEDLTTINFIDAGVCDNETLISGDVYLSKIELSEWYPNIQSRDTTEIVGTTLFKTIKIQAEESSDFILDIYNKERNKTYNYLSEYCNNRRAFIGSTNKNIKLTIKNQNEKGFCITSFAYEGQYNTRSRNVNSK